MKMINEKCVVVVFALICLLASQCLHSQEFRGIEGRWQISNISPEEARQRAIEEAKKEALRRAGIEERIRATEALSTIDSKEQFQQMYSSFSSVELNGAITRFDVVKDEIIKENIDGQLYATITINATVKKYTTKPDPEFKFEVRGLRNGYRNGELITFSVNPNKEGYLKIFVVDNNVDAAQLFPNYLEPNRKMNTKENVSFPTSNIQYTAKKTTKERHEHNLWVFVYTKSDIPFYSEVTYQSVLDWINKIEPYDREVVIEVLLLTE